MYAAVGLYPLIIIIAKSLAGQTALVGLFPYLRQVGMYIVMGASNQVSIATPKFLGPALTDRQITHILIEHRNAHRRKRNECKQLLMDGLQSRLAVA